MTSARLHELRRTARDIGFAFAAALLVTGLLAASDLRSSSADLGAADGVAALASASVGTGMKKVSAGGEHTCGIDSGKVYCWGRNTWGQLGSSTRSGAIANPVKVRGKNWRKVSAGGATSCGIKGKKKKMKCWGLNNRGQLGSGNTKWKSKPVKLARKKKGWKKVDTGWYHTCAIRKKKKLFCWGDNTYGQLGIGSNKGKKTKPVRVKGKWRKVAVEGWTTCAIKKNRSLRCWGRNILGQVGDGTTKDRDKPIKIDGANWKRVDLSWTHGCAVRSDRTTWCWGNNNRGQIGDGTASRRPRPTLVAGLGGAREVATAEFGSCVTTQSDQLYCWGDDRYGQIGGGGGGAHPRPQRLPGSYDKVSSGWMHSCGRRAGGGIDCWGNDERAQVRAAAVPGTLRTDATAATETPTEEPSTATGPLAFRLATYNVLGEIHTGPYRPEDGFAPSRIRAEWTMQAVRTHQLDIIGMQEGSAGQTLAMLKAGEGRYDAFPHPTEDTLSTETTILWDTTKFEAVEKHTISTLFIKRNYPRPYIKFRERSSGREFWVMNVHNAPWDYKKKRKKARKPQLAKIQELEATGLPVYYIGDFNEKKKIVCKVLKKTGLVSPLGGRLKASGKCKPPRGMRVDWIFGSDETQWTNYVQAKYPVIRLSTDHWVHMVNVRVP